MFKAELETRNFSFEAYGSTPTNAKLALLAGLDTHGKQCELPATWFYDNGWPDEVRLNQVDVGFCYRDREQLGDRFEGAK